MRLISLRLVLPAAVLFTLLSQSVEAQVTRSSLLPVGPTLDLASLPLATPVDPNDSAFTSIGISSITASNRPSSNSEFYDAGIFDAGPALFGNEAGELLVLEQGAAIDFGSPVFTIDFIDPASSFGFRFADTSDGFATPKVDFFNGGGLVSSFTITESFDANSEFGFSSATGFDRVVIDVDTVGTGFGFDGVGITDLTVISSVPEPSSVLPFVLVALAFMKRRRGRS